MRKHILLTILAIAALGACEQATRVQKPSMKLVQSILADTTGLRERVQNAGIIGAEGSITLLGESADVKTLARRFKEVDLMDNVDGREKRDSLPDFAGEIIVGILTPRVSPDSLREVAVNGALQAWDTTRRKESAKILIYPASLQAAYGFHDVDTLQRIAGGKCHLLSPVSLLLDKAFEKTTHVAVWTSEAAKTAKVWERSGKTPAVYWADPALTPGEQLRDILRQYQVTGLPLDALIVDSYQMDWCALEEELKIIRAHATEEDTAFDKMLSAQFKLYDPADALIREAYGILRKENLFAHRLALPEVKFYDYVPELH